MNKSELNLLETDCGDFRRLTKMTKIVKIQIPSTSKEKNKQIVQINLQLAFVIEMLNKAKIKEDFIVLTLMTSSNSLELLTNNENICLVRRILK